MIRTFEYTFELAWNMLKDYFEAQGDTDIHGSHDAIHLCITDIRKIDRQLYAACFSRCLDKNGHLQGRVKD